jgi:hypothetical protein
MDDIRNKIKEIRELRKLRKIRSFFTFDFASLYPITHKKY